MAKHKYIETPEKMWELFEAYVKDIKARPFAVIDYVGKDGEAVTRYKEKPLTMVGFECYVYNQGLNGDLSHYFANIEERYTDYLAICSRVLKSIKQDQIEGGMANQYNTSITQRLNGLVEKQSTELSGQVTQVTITEKTRES